MQGRVRGLARGILTFTLATGCAPPEGPPVDDPTVDDPHDSEHGDSGGALQSQDGERGVGAGDEEEGVRMVNAAQDAFDMGRPAAAVIQRAHREQRHRRQGVDGRRTSG